MILSLLLTQQLLLILPSYSFQHQQHHVNHPVTLTSCTSNRNCELLPGTPLCDPITHLCVPSTCLNNIKDSDEADVDCSGPCGRKCGDLSHCKSSLDCESGLCSLSGMCLPLSCSNGRTDGDETSKDCGGTICDPCPPGGNCERAEDCLTGLCETDDRYICLRHDCDDDDVVLGHHRHPHCPRQGIGKPCAVDKECTSDYCDDNICFPKSCRNTRGTVGCPKLLAGESCETDESCRSGECNERKNICVAESCSSSSTSSKTQQQQQQCGGLCPSCSLGNGPCITDLDCEEELACSLDSQICVPKHCINRKLDVNLESDIDCGMDCAPYQLCSPLEKCQSKDDCDSEICDLDAQKCISKTCINRKLDNHEADIDCGNSALSGCLPCQKIGNTCNENGDADSSLGLVCHLRVVVPLTCFNGELDSNEIDVDCGGSCAKLCNVGQMCRIDDHCASSDCYQGTCLDETCRDGKRSGNETALDCGGGFCRPCHAGEHCLEKEDCISGLCSMFTNKCQPEICATKCGGPCDPCVDTSPCSGDSDCLSGYCAQMMIGNES
jgi:hypothetical protein